ncbi:MAG: DUF460 domain-containing protein [Candidatus Aenigmarchaeota archaeon]|nr:DUF460 domain-containing protein [Candidatus Aenigmarchaeota archaeon]
MSKRGERQLLIAGIDVGLHTGVALLDLDGEIIFLESVYSPTMSYITNTISKHGNVISISTDREKTPAKARKIASALGTSILAPMKNMTNKKKRILIESFTRQEKLKLDSHQKAALASAIFAYRNYTPRLKKLRERLEKERLPERYEEIREDFLLGRYRLSEELKNI